MNLSGSCLKKRLLWLDCSVAAGVEAELVKSCASGRDEGEAGD